MITNEETMYQFASRNDDDENAVLDLSNEIICLRCYQEELWYLIA